MKKSLQKLFSVLFVLTGVLAFSACSSDDDAPKSYPVKVNLTFADTLSFDDASHVQLFVTSQIGTDTFDLASGTLDLILKQGTYSFSVKGKMKDEANAYLSGLKANVPVYGEVAVEVPVAKVLESTLIIKTIYNNCTKMGYLKDTFLEIVNNSDEVQYLDGVIIYAPGGGQSQMNAWQANGYLDIYPVGQGAVVQFPGTGKEHPLLPGQSVIVANDAANHKELSGDENCADLSNADWEIYLDYQSSEVDNQDIPNLKVLWTNNKYMFAFGLGLTSRAYVLARLPEGMTGEAYAEDPASKMTTPGTASTTEYMVFPAKYTLDAVDVWDPNNETPYPTFLPQDDKAGIPSGSMWSGTCERRKVSKVVNGRKYYQDTNNSAEDFLNKQPLVEQ